MDAEIESRPITGGVVMGAVSRIVVAGTGALTTIFVARLLGPDGSGGYFVAQSTLLLLTVATTLGIEHGIAYYVSAGRWAPRPALAAALRMAVLTGAVGALAGVLARLAFPSAFAGLSVPTTAVAAAALPFWLSFYYVTYVALAIDRYEAFVVPPAAQSALALVLVSLGAVGYGLAGAVTGLAVSVAVVGVGSGAWAARRLPPGAAAAPGSLRRAMSFGLKGYLANALQVVNYRLDIFILSSVTGAAAVGHYAVAVAVTSVLWLLPNALAEVVFPRVAHLSAREGDGAEAQREMVEIKGLRHVVIAAGLSAAVLALALLVLVVPVYGPEFRPAIDLGLILLPGTAAIGISNVLASTIIGRGHPIYGLYIVLVTLPLTVALYIWLIPTKGATGAALASTISYGATFALMAAFYQRLTGRSVVRSMVPTSAELADLVAVPAAGAAWLRGLRR